MIHLMHVLKVILGLKSKQGDVTATFNHAQLPDEHIHIKMPQVRKDFQATLYGLWQSNCAIWWYMVEKREKFGMK